MGESEIEALSNPTWSFAQAIGHVAQWLLKTPLVNGSSSQTIAAPCFKKARPMGSYRITFLALLYCVAALCSQKAFSADAEKVETPREIAKSLYELRDDKSAQAKKKIRDMMARLELSLPKRSVAYRATFHTTVEDCCFDPSYALEILELDAKAGNNRSKSVLGMFLKNYLPSLAAGTRLAPYPDARRKIVLPENAKQKGEALIRDAAGMGDPLALYIQGSDCVTGADAHCSKLEAKRLLESASKVGSGLAASMRAAIALEIDGDRESAKEWAERGEKLGNPEASWLMLKIVSTDSKMTDLLKDPLLLKHVQAAAFGCLPEAEVALTRAYLDLKVEQVDVLRTAIVTWGLISKGRGRKWADEIFAKASAVQIPESSVKNVNELFPCPPPFWLQ